MRRAVNIHGVRVFDLGDETVARFMEGHKAPPPGLDKWRRLAAAPSCTVVDTAAGHGLFSIAAAQEGALVHAFEPSARKRARLRSNVNANDVNSLVRVHTPGSGLLTLDDYVRAHVITACHALRVVQEDIVLVLGPEGSSETLSRFRPTVLLHTTDEGYAAVEAMFRELKYTRVKAAPGVSKLIPRRISK